jgi:hypothetical protein
VLARGQVVIRLCGPHVVVCRLLGPVAQLFTILDSPAPASTIASAAILLIRFAGMMFPANCCRTKPPAPSRS